MQERGDNNESNYVRIVPNEIINYNNSNTQNSRKSVGHFRPTIYGSVEIYIFFICRKIL